MGEIWKRLGEKQKKLISWLALVALVGMALLILQPPEATTVVPKTFLEPEESTSVNQVSLWQRELTNLVNSYLGTKGSQVLLTLDRGPKLVIAHNSTIEERKSADGSYELRQTTTPVILRNDGARRETPLVLEELEATIRGVVVILDHEPQVQLRLEIASAVATVLQIPMYRIEVLFKQ